MKVKNAPSPLKGEGWGEGEYNAISSTYIPPPPPASQARALRAGLYPLPPGEGNSTCYETINFKAEKLTFFCFKLADFFDKINEIYLPAIALDCKAQLIDVELETFEFFETNVKLSFPRRRESSYIKGFIDSRFRGNDTKGRNSKVSTYER